MAVDKTNRKTNAALPKHAARDGGGHVGGIGGKRVVAPLSPNVANKSLTRSRLADTLFLAHLFASRFQEPQPREQPRADPAADNASYRKNAKRSAKKRRIVSKKA